MTDMNEHARILKNYELAVDRFYAFLKIGIPTKEDFKKESDVFDKESEIFYMKAKTLAEFELGKSA